MNNWNYRRKIISETKLLHIGVNRYFLCYFLLSTILIFVSLGNPVLYSLFLEKVIISRNLTIIIWIVVGYLSLQIISSLISYLQTICRCQINNSLLLTLKKQLMKRFLRCNFQEYDKMDPGCLRMLFEEDTKRIKEFSCYQTVEFLISIIKLVIFLILLFMLNYQMAILAVIVIPVTFLFDYFISSKEKNINEKIHVNDEDLSTFLYQATKNAKEIRALNLIQEQNNTFWLFSNRDAKYMQKWLHFWVTRVLVIPKLKDSFVMQFLLYFVGGLLIYRDAITIGALLVFVQYYNLLSQEVTSISKRNADLKTNQPFYDRLLIELTKANDINATLVKAVVNCSLKKETIIELKNVSYSYPTEKNTRKNILENYSLVIKSGERLGIMGASGSGKTTLLKLITGMLYPDTGELIFHGNSIRSFSTTEYLKHISYIQQETILFNSSIRENMLYAKQDLSDNEIENACRQSGIADFIESLPEKYNTIIGEKGVRLSGGQRQRLAIARSLLKDSDVLILDEATCSLDRKVEVEILNTLSTLDRKKTLVMVAHRKESLEICDRIISLT